jgi:hypothetical protein
MLLALWPLTLGASVPPPSSPTPDIEIEEEDNGDDGDDDYKDENDE